MSDHVIPQLFNVIQQRKANPPERSYTVDLLSAGVERIGGKIREEAAEVVEAAAESGPDGPAHLIHEAADLLYHLLVMLAHREVEWADVEAELARRFGVSGLDEKAARAETRKL